MNLVSTFLIVISCTTVVYTQNLRKGDVCQIQRSVKKGICKLTKDCPVVDEYRRKGITFNRCGYEGRQTILCCPDEAAETTTAAYEPKRISEIKCVEYKSAVYERSGMAHVSLIADAEKGTNLVDKCGIKFIQLIIGGENANPTEFPHMALIGITNGRNQMPTWICGGSLISHTFVLTAAHCLPKNPNIVRLGELDYSRNDDEASPQDYGIMEAKIHPDYRYMESKYHDIALLKLAGRVVFNKFIRPACLPSSSTITQKLAIVSGWGVNETYGDETSRLQKVVLNLFNQSECAADYSKQINEPIIGNQFCAGSKTEDKDTCQGDSGGPLQVFHEGIYCMYRIIGVTSFGVTCADRIPGVYTRVYSYLDWIEENVWGNSPSRIFFED